MQFNYRTHISDTLNQAIDVIVQQIKTTLGDDIVGCYLYGSITTPDFDESISDVDLHVVTKSRMDKNSLPTLRKIHDNLLSLPDKWGQRIDISYISKTDLLASKIMPSHMVIGTHGSELEAVKSKDYYVIDWYKILTEGIVLHGTLISDVMPPITKEEFRDAIRRYASGWTKEVRDKKRTKPDCAYIVLTMCRCLYACIFGVHATKPQGALWATETYPQYRKLVSEALSLSRSEHDEYDPTYYRKTVQFVDMINQEMANREIIQ